MSDRIRRRKLDLAHGRVDLLRRLATLVDKGGESGFEAGLGEGEAAHARSLDARAWWR